MPVCPECLSRKMVKFGRRGMQQRWHCQQCRLTTIYPLKRMPSQRNGIRRSSSG